MLLGENTVKEELEWDEINEGKLPVEVQHPCSKNVYCVPQSGTEERERADGNEEQHKSNQYGASTEDHRV